jgi:Protein of unknown function (DUF1513)
MTSQSRRGFLGTMTFLGGSVLTARQGMTTNLPATSDCGAPAPVSRVRPDSKGLVYGLGGNGRYFPGQSATGPYKVSVLTSLNLADGSIRQTALEVPNGHAAIGMGDGRILCLGQHREKSMVIDRQHRPMADLLAPEGYVFGGHGLVLADRGVVVLPFHARKQLSLTDTGILRIYDQKTFALIDQVSTGGLQPHEIHMIPGQDEIALTHYGDIHVPKSPFEANVVEPKLTVLDAQTFKPKRHYIQEGFNALVTHMRVDKHGWAYYVLTQYIKWPEKTETDGDPFAVAAAEIEETLGHKLDFPLPYQSEWDDRFALPLPLVRVDTQTGERQIINAGDAYHLRSQSVAYSDAMGQAIATYVHSDTLIIHEPGKPPEVVPARDLNISDVRGVTEIAGTSLIAVMGTYRGVALYDLRTRQLVNYYATLNYEDTHLYYDRA